MGRRRAGSRGGAPVSRILEVRVVLEGGVTENHRGLGTAANWEGVSNDRPLRTRSHGGWDWPAHMAGFQSPESRLSQPHPAAPLHPCPYLGHPCPYLGLPCQNQDLPQVMQQPHQVEPVWEGE